MVWFAALFALRCAHAPGEVMTTRRAAAVLAQVKHFALDQNHRLVPTKLLHDPVFPPENRRTVSPTWIVVAGAAGTSFGELERLRRLPQVVDLTKQPIPRLCSVGAALAA